MQFFMYNICSFSKVSRRFTLGIITSLNIVNEAVHLVGVLVNVIWVTSLGPWWWTGTPMWDVCSTIIRSQTGHNAQKF